VAIALILRADVVEQEAAFVEITLGQAIAVGLRPRDGDRSADRIAFDNAIVRAMPIHEPWK
jgi:hypothetical protein